MGLISLWQAARAVMFAFVDAVIFKKERLEERWKRRFWICWRRSVRMMW